jgi:superfamily II DNA or RNA helicase
MDNASNYGQVCAQMSFVEAENLGIICPYKVIVSVVDTNSLKLESIDNGIVSGNTISVRDAAIRESILLALTKYDTKKVITYHSTIEQAEEFASIVLNNAVSDYEILHVNSDMTGKQRHDIMQRFRQASRAIITNARCLTEGIDVPAVDMIVFADPKHSEIDIVQAIGRVMRVSEGKTTGYVFLPLFLDQKSGEPIIEALNRSHYEMVWDVLNALCAADKNFESQIILFRQSLGIEGRLPPDLDRLKVIVPPGIEAQVIKESVSIFIVRQLSDSWEEHYGELLHYKKEHGNIAVPARTRLGGWLNSQRYLWNNLTREKQERLLMLGYDLNPSETRWMGKYEELRALKKQYGHINTASRNLKEWLMKQRSYWNVLTNEKRELLLNLGYDPYSREKLWQKRLEELRAYKEEHGHCNVIPSDNAPLSGFLVETRNNYHKGKLAPDKIAIFEGLGIVWGGQWERLFEDTYHKMSAYREEHGCLPPSNTRLREEKAIVNRMLMLRRAYHSGRLSCEQIQRIKELGFSFEPDIERWQMRYRELEAYVSEVGDPNRISIKNHLRGWVRNIKALYKRGNMPQEKIELLEKLGVKWDDEGYMNELWETNFQIVSDYFKENRVNVIPSTHIVYSWWQQQLL